jgi:O-antigen ligase
MAVPLALRRGRLLALPVIVAGLIISDTATAAMAALVACGVMLWFEYRHSDDGRFYLLVGLVMLGGLAAGYLQMADDWNVLVNDRWTVWSRAWSGIKASPWFGYGLGSFRSAGIVEGGVYFKQAHNEFVQLAFETGAPGLALALAFVVERARRLRTASLAAAGAFAAMVVLALGSFPLHTADLAVWSVPFLGMLSREDC